MSDVKAASGAPDPVYEVCIVGTGITGLNALVVASSYLTRSDKVAVVDARDRVGGMWVDTYRYVRLHQPHGIFTAGNIPWTLGADPSHLASRTEVLDHFDHCLEVARQQVGVDEYLGWEYLSHRELPDAVEVTVRRAGDSGTRLIRAKRLIKALGHQLAPTAPLPLASGRVRSITPEMLDLTDAGRGAGDEPVWLVGAGKTAMDTAHLLITHAPGREVNVVAGPGVIFARRETFFPVGVRRWWAGTPINTMVREAANRFDGTNEAEVRDWFRATYGITPIDGATDYFNGYLSESECAVIRAGLSSVEHEYLDDVTDDTEGASLVFRSGRTVSVPTGAWIVNCTGTLLRDGHPYEPFVSAGGRVASLQMRSSTTGVFSSFAGYYLPHLLLRNELGDAGLYAMDVEDLHHKHKSVAIYASMSLAMHNLSLLSEILPTKVMLACGLDFDRWYPLPRRLLGVTKFMLKQRQEREHHRGALDTLGQRFDVTCGPLTSAGVQAAATA
jgi:hypothetical protein